MPQMLILEREPDRRLTQAMCLLQKALSAKAAGTRSRVGLPPPVGLCPFMSSVWIGQEEGLTPSHISSHWLLSSSLYQCFSPAPTPLPGCSVALPRSDLSWLSWAQHLMSWPPSLRLKGHATLAFTIVTVLLQAGELLPAQLIHCAVLGFLPFLRQVPLPATPCPPSCQAA